MADDPVEVAALIERLRELLAMTGGARPGSFEAHLQDVFRVSAESLAALVQEIERLRGQLPEGMQDCTIQFKECEQGHGRLTATNWVQHDCPWCSIAILRAAKCEEIEALKKDHATALIQAEQDGFNRGLRHGRGELATLRARLAKAEAVVEAARRMRAATEEYARQTDLEPPDCSVIAEQKARSAEYRATVALDAALAALAATKETPDAG